MIQNYNNYRILKIFLDDPLHGFGLREISRILKLGLPSVSNYIKQLEKEEALLKLGKIYGASKRKTTDDNLKKAKKLAFEDLEKEFNL